MFESVALSSSSAPPWAIYAALITAALALFGQAVSRIWQARDRRRDEYSEAFATAMEWTEFSYRIARRLSNDAEAVDPIVAAMHESQERICFHTNWLRTVSDDIEKAYSGLVASVKTKSAPHIQKAWRQEPARVPEGMILGNAFPVDVTAEVDEFVRQMRRDLSVRRYFAVWRYFRR
jgi:uncharacterized protein YhaN